jgi:hypothetical protein
MAQINKKKNKFISAKSYTPVKQTINNSWLYDINRLEGAAKKVRFVLMLVIFCTTKGR